MTDLRRCSTCKQDLLETDFQILKNGKRKRQCLSCNSTRFYQTINDSPKTYLSRLCSTSRGKVLKREGIPFTIDPEHLIELWEKQEGRCALSGVYMTHHRDGSGRKDLNASLDRLIGSKGYVPGNVQLVCHRVNIMRHTLSVDMLYWWVKTINDHSCD